MILVTGATGNVGRELVRLLRGAGRAVRVLARDPARAAGLGDGVEIIRGDLIIPGSLAPALVGVEKVFLVAGAMDLATATAHTIEAARRAGVRHIVLISSATISIDPPVAIGRWHLAAEEHLRSSGLAWTMLRPGAFASNALRWAGSIRAQGSVYAPAGAGRSAPIDPRDIAAVAARALTTPGHEGSTHVLTGPELMTSAEQVERLGAAIGRTLRLVDVPEAGARAGMVKGGMSEHLADAVLELMRASGRGEAAMLTSTVSEVTGREARTFDEWARDHAAHFTP